MKRNFLFWIFNNFFLYYFGYVKVGESVFLFEMKGKIGFLVICASF